MSMEVEFPNSRELTEAEKAHLEKLKTLVTTALEDGHFSKDELDRIKSMLTGSREIMYAELRTINDTIKSVMGGVVPELDWD